MLAVNSQVPVKDLRELMALSKAEPDRSTTHPPAMTPSTTCWVRC